jgi:hypothetical protein
MEARVRPLSRFLRPTKLCTAVRACSKAFYRVLADRRNGYGRAWTGCHTRLPTAAQVEALGSKPQGERIAFLPAAGLCPLLYTIIRTAYFWVNKRNTNNYVREEMTKTASSQTKYSCHLQSELRVAFSPAVCFVPGGRDMT